MASQIVFNYNALPQADDSITIQDSLQPTNNWVIVYESSNPNTLSLPIAATISENITNLVNFLNASFNATGLYTITADYINDRVVVLGNNVNSQFTELANTTSGRITTTITNVPAPSVYQINSVSFATSATPCTHVTATVTTSLDTQQITSPVNEIIADLTTFDVEVPRQGQSIFTTIATGTGESVTFGTIFNIPTLSVANFSLQTNTTPTGGNVIISNSYPINSILTFTYSIDNVNFFTTNSFTNLAVGSYTLYIRDNYGCTITTTFDITAFTPNVVERQDIVEVSNLNSLRYKICQDFDTTPKNIDNTLSYEEETQVVNKDYAQPYEKTDGIITEQFWTSYDTVTATLIDCEGTETSLTVTQKSNNSDITDVRDGLLRSVLYNADNYVGVQMSSGNTYDSITLAVNGQYNNGSVLPSFVNTEDLLNIQGLGWYKVIDIIFVDGIQTAILELLTRSLNFTIGINGESRRITSIYNILPYEIYEYDLDLSNLEGFYQVRIDFTDTTFTDKQYLSEYIDVRTKHDKTYLIEWYNTEQTQINWNTGKRGKARYKYIYNAKLAPNVTQEVVQTDTGTVQLDSVNRQSFLYQFFPIPQGMIDKLNLIFSQDRIFIDKINVLRETEPEQTPISGSNLYLYNQTLVRSDFQFEQAINVDQSNINVDSAGLFTSDGKTGLLLIR